MWKKPEELRLMSVLKRYPVTVTSTIRSMAVDEKAKRFWLIHDSGAWCEGIVRGEIVEFDLSVGI